MKVLTNRLLKWYRKNRVPYPWRKTNLPYRIWLSEILLQQTRIPVAINFYTKILKQYPNLKALAGVKDSEFLALWSGIGYYRRAFNMLACARKVTEKHRGKFPSELCELLQLPGIGNYTAGAIRNISFGILTPAIDGNVRRVLSRLLMSDADLETGFMRLGNGFPSIDFFQSLMELGQRICLPKPKCSLCPVRDNCQAHKTGRQNEYPKKLVRKRAEIFHWYLLILQSNGSIYYLQNPSRAFLKEAWLFPDLLSKKKISSSGLIHQFNKTWGIQLKDVREFHVLEHAVTFRKIFAHILVPGGYKLNGVNGKWLAQQELQRNPTSSITQKVLKMFFTEDSKESKGF